MKHWLRLGSGKPWLHCLLILAVNDPYYRYTGANQLWILPRIGMVPFHSGTRLDSPFRQFAGCSFKTRNGQHLSGE